MNDRDAQRRVVSRVHAVAAVASASVFAFLCLLLTASPAGAAAFASGGLRAGEPASVAPSTPKTGSADDVAGYVNRERDQLRLPGVAVVVLRDGRPLVSRGFGEADPSGRPVTAKTPFVLGSTSKQFTGLMVQRLILEGRLDMETTAHEVLPWFGKGNDALSRVTVRELLTHSSGLSSEVGLAQWGWRLGRADSITAGARAITEADIVTAPGERFIYSNSNYDILGAIIEGIVKEPYAIALDELVAAPLGLTSTTADLRHRPPGLAAGYYAWLGRVSTVTPAPAIPSAAPSAMVVSTADDLARVVEAQLGLGDLVPLGPALAAARAPLLRVDPYSQYASGWFVRPLWELHAGNENPTDASLTSCIEHDGSTDRSMSYLLACPALGLAVVALTNTGQGPDRDVWWRFHNGLVHTILGTPAGNYVPDLIIRYVTVIIIGVPLVLLGTLLAQVRAGRRRRHVLRWSAPPILLGAGALWLGYIYAPGAAGGVPVHAMWASMPDLAVSAIVDSTLTLLSLLVLAIAVLGPQPDSGRPLPQP